MLDQLRKAAGSLLAKLLLSLLVLSFAVWGVAGKLAGGRQLVVATVGNTEISAQRYQIAFQNEIARVSAQIGRRLTPEQARAFGLEQRVLNHMLGSAAIDNHASDLKLAISDKSITDAIRSDPNLKGPDGKFSKAVFEQILRRIDMSEATFIATQRKEEIRQQLTNALAADAAVPAPLVETMNRYQNETRIIKAFTLDPKVSGKVPAPDDKALKTYYEQDKSQFVTPRYRKVILLAVTDADAAKLVKLTDEQLRQSYQQTKSLYDIAEKRHILQIAFPDKAAAEKARKELSQAEDFNKAAKKLGFKQSDYDIGEKTRADMIDPAIAEAAFKLAKGQLSEPIEGTFATVLLRVSDIKPGKESTFDGVKDKVRRKLARQQARLELQKLLNKIDDERGTGKTLQEIAAVLKLKALDIAAIDSRGRDKAGKPVLAQKKTLSPADQQKIIAAIFAGGVGVENDVVELGDGGYTWFDITSETLSRQRSFKEAKADVKAILIDLNSRKAITRAARAAVKQINDGTPIEAVAKKLNRPLITTKAVKRQARPKGLSQAAMHRAFSLKKGASASALTDDRKSRSIIAVTQITTPPPPTAAEKKALGAALSRQIGGDVLNEYVTALMTRYGRSVNRAAFNQANGREPVDGQGGGGFSLF